VLIKTAEASAVTDVDFVYSMTRTEIVFIQHASCLLVPGWGYWLFLVAPGEQDWPRGWRLVLGVVKAVPAKCDVCGWAQDAWTNAWIVHILFKCMYAVFVGRLTARTKG
jgi:hypothetical protein